MYVQLTDNVINKVVGATDYTRQGIALIIANESEFGGGTLTLNVKPARSNMAPQPLKVAEPLAPGSQELFVIGSDMEYSLTLEDATDPDIQISISAVS